MGNKNKIIAGVIAVTIAIVAFVLGMFVQSMHQCPVSAYQKAPSYSEIKVANDKTLGKFLVGPKGMTLYAKQGESGSSTCYADCAVNWTPLQSEEYLDVAAGITGSLGLIERTDGIKQITYNNKPLYYWINDKAVGDITGNGVNKIWSVVAP